MHYFTILLENISSADGSCDELLTAKKMVKNRLSVSKMDMRNKLQPHKAEFDLTAFPAKATDFKIHFDTVALYVDRLELNPSVIYGHAKDLKSYNALYLINHAELLTYTIPAGQLSCIHNRLFPDVDPNMMMITMTENTVEKYS